MRKEVDLTEDLDDVYKMLNALRTGGGDEYVARVTKTALDEQKWSTDKNALKLIFVCGNEPVDQDKQVTLEDVAAQAKKAGVIVNTIYCKWGHDAEIAGVGQVRRAVRRQAHGHRHEQGRQQVVVKTEFDDQIIKLGEELNKTYVAYGKDGQGQGREPGRPGQERRERRRSAKRAAAWRPRKPRPSPAPSPRPARCTATAPGTSWTR